MVLLVAAHRLHRSSDGGETFTPVGSLYGQCVSALLVVRMRSQVVALAGQCDGSILASLDAGAAWFVIVRARPAVAVAISSLARGLPEDCALSPRSSLPLLIGRPSGELLVACLLLSPSSITPLPSSSLRPLRSASTQDEPEIGFTQRGVEPHLGALVAQPIEGSAGVCQWPACSHVFASCRS